MMRFYSKNVNFYLQILKIIDNIYIARKLFQYVRTMWIFIVTVSKVVRGFTFIMYNVNSCWIVTLELFDSLHSYTI